MDAFKEIINNADTALVHGRVEEALALYKKALTEKPDDIYALQRAGEISARMQLYEDALKYFGKCRQLEPENGEHAFDYANACFFNRHFAKAFENYIEAERLGCSDGVLPRLYYQLALIGISRKDYKTARVYLKKCEEADLQGVVALDPDMIVERVKMEMLLGDFEAAERQAARLVAAAPEKFSHYMVHFSLLMQLQKYDKAEKVLADAEKYAELTDENRLALIMQKAKLFMEKAAGDDNRVYSRKVVQLLEEYLGAKNITAKQRSTAKITLASAYLDLENYDKALACLAGVDTTAEKETAPVQAEPQPQPKTDKPAENTERAKVLVYDAQGNPHYVYADSKASAAAQPQNRYNVQQKETVVYDALGNPHYVKTNAAGKVAAKEIREDLMDYSEELPEEAVIEDTEAGEYELTAEEREKVQFLTMSAYIGKDDFAPALEIAEVLKHSENKYFAYYGLYVCALMKSKLYGMTEEVKGEYTKTIAFFRSRTFENPGDSYALVFRARMYAETGKYAKAKELARLLADGDREVVLKYIDTCAENR